MPGLRNRSSWFPSTRLPGEGGLCSLSTIQTLTENANSNTGYPSTLPQAPKDKTQGLHSTSRRFYSNEALQAPLFKVLETETHRLSSERQAV